METKTGHLGELRVVRSTHSVNHLVMGRDLIKLSLSLIILDYHKDLGIIDSERGKSFKNAIWDRYEHRSYS